MSQTPRNNKKKESLNNYAKYTGIGFQMLAIILIGIWGGTKLDGLVNFKFPLFTVLFSFISVGLAIYVVIKDLLK